MGTRRIVTGFDQGGKSVFVSDGLVEPSKIEGILEIALLWAADAPATFPCTGTLTRVSQYFPPVGGVRFAIFTVHPSQVTAAAMEAMAPEDLQKALARVGQEVGNLEVGDDPEPGMHTTDTTDFLIVLSGNPVCELDGGATKQLSPGDTLVQNGVRHRWLNPGAEPAYIAAVLVGAYPR